MDSGGGEVAPEEGRTSPKARVLARGGVSFGAEEKDCTEAVESRLEDL